MKRPIRVVQYGLGYIGSAIARLAMRRPGLKVVGAIDISADKVGRDLGIVVGSKRLVGVQVSSEAERVLSSVEPDVVLHATSSRLNDVMPQIRQAVSYGADVVSTCEELAYPWLKHPRLALQLDKLAKNNGATVLGVGVNPGFVMDALVLAMSGVCQSIDKIEVSRIVDLSTRRLALKRKMGVGLTESEFKQAVESGTIGHVGLSESVALIADALGWRLSSIKETMKPVVRGKIVGLVQEAFMLHRGVEAITLYLEMVVGAKHPSDSISISGVPPVNLVIKGGIQGDLATAALAVNSIPRVVNAPTGLKTVKDIPMAAAVLGDFKRFVA